MNVEHMGTSHSDLWASFNHHLSSLNKWKSAMVQAKIYGSGCYKTRCKASYATNYSPPDPAVTPNVSSRVSYNCYNRQCQLLSTERYNEYLAKHPNARLTDTEAAKAAGNPPALLGCGVEMGITADEIRVKRDRVKWHAGVAKKAVTDYMYSRGINANVMDYGEVMDYIGYINQKDTGDPIAAIIIRDTAPSPPDIIPQGGWPVDDPVGEPFTLASIPAYVLDFVKPENLAKNWPGLALGFVLFMAKTRKRKAATT